MEFEVEQKFPVAEMATVELKLIGLGAEISQPRQERDLYFAHPARDFGETDEALRIRRRGLEAFITYKGPKLDPITKTRREIDLPLPTEAGSADAWQALVEALGFQPVAEVPKQRRKAFVAWQGRRVEVSLDYVAELGTFVELELVTHADDIEPAKSCIAALAEELGLSQSERRSYLELLLESRGAVE